MELRRRRIDLSTIIEQAVESTMPLHEARRHEVRRAVPATPAGPRHPARLGQVLSNLLHNAAKYTPEGGLVDVSVGRDQQMLEVRVRDNGQGLAAEHLERVFELFTQIDRDRGYGGLGIGLTVARELVQRHGGTLHVESPGLGAGSTFIVRLPVDDGRRRTAGRRLARTGRIDGGRAKECPPRGGRRRQPRMPPTRWRPVSA